MAGTFGARRIYYNNFASHLLNRYNPNMLYPSLPLRWSDKEWCRLVDMVGAFGFNVFEFWLVPRFFSREGLDAPWGRSFICQMNRVVEHAHDRGMKVEMICALATVGARWHTLCPNLEGHWRELLHLWGCWADALPELDIVGIFPGDPGACSRNGCTAETFVDRACDVAQLLKKRLPHVEVEMHTWGPPFFGWGIIEGPPHWQGAFLHRYQHTAWRFDKRRCDTAMGHLLRRLPEFPKPTSVAVNLGFNSDGNPAGEESAVAWAHEIARHCPIHTWDFSLTEGENAIAPHWRFPRLYARRRQERDAAPYSGGICFTMTPLLNQLSLFQAARSFAEPDADCTAVAEEFCCGLFGPAGRELADRWPLFEAVPDWGSYGVVDLGRAAYHRAAAELVEVIRTLPTDRTPAWPFHPGATAFRDELAFFAGLFADLSSPSPDYDRLAGRYWNRVYAIYDRLPQHVDPRPRAATDHLIQHFRQWQT